MWFFSDNSDKHEEELNVRFHRGKMQYVPCDIFGNDIPEDELTFAQAKLLEERNNTLNDNSGAALRVAMMQSENAERAAKLQKMGFPCNSFEVLSTSRSTKSISPEIMKWLSDLVSDDNALIGVHRTGMASLDDIAEMLRCGLIINSRDGGAASSEIHIMNTVSYYSNNDTVMKEVLCADAYKNSLGSILIKIPDEALQGNIFMIDADEGTFFLDPQYIIGFIPVGPNGQLSEVIASNYYNGGGKPFVKPIAAIYDDREYASTPQETIKVSSGEGTKK